MAKEAGFLSVGISRAEHMEDEAKKLEKWLQNDLHGEMSYMANHFDLRVDPRKLMPNAKSVISLSYNYYTDKKQSDTEAPRISMYAFGRDYHKVIRKKLKSLVRQLQGEIGDFAARIFVDSAPILERDWAKRSGMGWIGKHTLLLNKKVGSYFFLAEIICDLELEYDHTVKNHCGDCTRCIDACPTGAISEKGYVLDASRCISYLTIELKNEIPKSFHEQMAGWMFGCDICQQVCPWNRFAVHHEESEFAPKKELLDMTKEDWIDLNEVTFNELFSGSAVKRTKFEGLKRNIKFVTDSLEEDQNNKNQ